MNRKNRIYLFIMLGLGFGVFYHEIRQVAPQVLWQELRQVKIGWLLVALGCMLLHWALEGKILQGLLKRQASDFSFKNAVRIPVIEHLFNAITPFSTGGQPAQLMALVKSGIDPGVSGSVCLMKFVVYQVMIVLNFIACLLFGFKLIANELAELSYLVLLGFGINVIVVISLLMLMYCYPVSHFIVGSVLRILTKFMSPEKGANLTQHVLAKMANFRAESQYMRQEKQIMVRTFGLTLLQLISYYIVPYFILLSLGVEHVAVLTIIVFHAFIILVISLFPIPGGTGGAEYSFALLFGSFIGTGSKLVLAIILWRLVTHYVGIFLGVAALFIQPDVKKELLVEH